MFTRSSKTDSNKTKAQSVNTEKAQGISDTPSYLVSPQNVMQLQSAIGNSAVLQLLKSHVPQQSTGSPIQRKEDGSNTSAALAERFRNITSSLSPAPVQRKNDSEMEQHQNNSGLPNSLKAGIENLSGIAMDGVKVFYNSDKPSQMGALAYTNGTDIHVAPGQEKHLPHEAWHVVQQKQGRVQPTMQFKGVGVNDNVGLENEADEMGERAAHAKINNEESLKKEKIKDPSPVIQRAKTRAKKRKEENKLRSQGLSLSSVMVGKRRTRKPNRFGQAPEIYLDRHGNRLLNPGSAEIMQVRMKLSGNSLKDIAELIRLTNRGRTGSGEVWHHMGDYDEKTGEGTIVLMPVGVHGHLRHIGGSAQKRAISFNDPDKKAKYGLS